MSDTTAATAATGEAASPNTPEGTAPAEHSDTSAAQAPATGSDLDNGATEIDGDDLANLAPADLAKMIRELRKENASARTTAKTKAADEARNDLAQTIGKALGLVTDGDQAPDPAKLADQLTAEQDRARAAAVELAIYRAAAKHGADPEALTDSRAFLSRVETLDPSDEKFGAKVADAIAKAVESNPKLRATGQAPTRSGAPIPGGPIGTNRPKNMADAVKRRYGS